MNALNPGGWRPEMPPGGGEVPPTASGNRALMLEEPLLFEIGREDVTGVDLPPVDASAPAMARWARLSASGRAVSRRKTS